MEKADQTPEERYKIDRSLVDEVRTLLKDHKQLEVIGHIDSAATCCRNGTVAIVKIDKGRPVP
jgi:hypothetical protein